MGLGEKQKVADLMCHAVETADRHYYVRKWLSSAPQAANIVRSVFYGDQCLPDTLPRSETEQCTSTEALIVTPVKEMCSSADNDTCELQTPKRKYTLPEVVKIRRLIPNRTTLREVPAQSTPVKKLLTELNVSPRQLYNKVTSMERYLPSQQVTRRKRTTNVQRAIIIKNCRSMMEGASRTDSMIFAALKDYPEILRELTYIQLRAIIEYESKKHPK